MNTKQCGNSQKPQTGKGETHAQRKGTVTAKERNLFIFGSD